MAVVWPSKNNFANGDVLTAANMNNIGDTLNVFNPTSATNGQIWVANGSGSGAYTTVASGGYTSLTSGTFTAGNTTLTLSSISSSYKHLYLEVWNMSFTASSPIIYVRLNNITSGSAYAWCQYGQTTTPALYSQAQTQNEFRIANGIAAGNKLSFQMFIPNYTQTQNIAYPANWFYASDNNDVIIGAGRVNNATPAAVNRIDIVASTSTFAGGSYELFGVN